MAPTGYSLTALRRTLLTLSLTCRRAADGWHAARLLRDLQQASDEFEQFL